MALTSTPSNPSITHRAGIRTAGQCFVGGNLAVDGTSEFDGAVTFKSASVYPTVTAFTQTYSTADATMANLTSATLTDNSGGTASGTIADITEANNAGSADRVPVENAIADLAAQCNALRVDLIDVKQALNSVIDTLQANGMAS